MRLAKTERRAHAVGVPKEKSEKAREQGHQCVHDLLAVKQLGARFAGADAVDVDDVVSECGDGALDFKQGAQGRGPAEQERLGERDDLQVAEHDFLHTLGEVHFVTLAEGGRHDVHEHAQNQEDAQHDKPPVLTGLRALRALVGALATMALGARVTQTRRRLEAEFRRAWLRVVGRLTFVGEVLAVFVEVSTGERGIGTAEACRMVVTLGKHAVPAVSAVGQGIFQKPNIGPSVSHVAFVERQEPPAGHVTHCQSWRLASVLLRYCSEVQSSGCSQPRLVHALSPVAFCAYPAGHCSQRVLGVVLCGWKKPRGHSRHREPLRGAKVPLPQGVHAMELLKLD